MLNLLLLETISSEKHMFLVIKVYIVSRKHIFDMALIEENAYFI